MNSITPILWLPGLLCDHNLFEPMQTHLPSWTSSCNMALESTSSMEKLALAVLKNAPEKFILGGLSMGGILAFEIYRQAPERIKGLILIDTNAADEKQDVTDRRNLLVDKAKKGYFDKITPDILLALLIHPNHLQNKELRNTICTMAENIGLEYFIQHAKALANRPDARAYLSEISVPTLVICGREDQLCPVENHLLMAQKIPHVSLHILPNCGHLSTLEYPNLVGQFISDWLSVNRCSFI